MQLQANNKFLFGIIIVAAVTMMIGGIIFSAQVFAQEAGVSTMSVGSTQCGGSGSGECDECEKNE